MANITWNVVQLNCKPKEGDFETVVSEVHWGCLGFNYDVNGVRYESHIYGSTVLPTPSVETFIPYAELTKDEVLNWIWANGVDKAATELDIVNQINAQIEPMIVTPPLPWENTVESQPVIGDENG